MSMAQVVAHHLPALRRYARAFLLDRSESPGKAGQRATDLGGRTAELRPRTVLGREWNGRMHRVAVLAEGAIDAMPTLESDLVYWDTASPGFGVKVLLVNLIRGMERGTCPAALPSIPVPAVSPH